MYVQTEYNYIYDFLQNVVLLAEVGGIILSSSMGCWKLSHVHVHVCQTVVNFKNSHLRKQFKTMKTFEQSYDHIYYKIGPVVQEEKIFRFRECTFATWILPPNVNRRGLSI